MFQLMDAAERVLELIRKADCNVRVFLRPDNVIVMLTPGEHRFCVLTSQFVGVYNRNVSARCIAEDIAETVYGREEMTPLKTLERWV
jgi:hypothetical protein